MSTTETLNDLLTAGAYGELSNFSWEHAYGGSAPEAALYGAIAFLRLRDVDNARGMLSLCKDQVDSSLPNTIAQLITLQLTGDLEPGFADLLTCALSSATPFGPVILRDLIDTASKHRWSFARSVEWAFAAVHDDLLRELFLSIWNHDPRAAINAQFQMLAVSRALSDRYMPDVSFLNGDTIKMWQEAEALYHLPQSCLVGNFLRLYREVRTLIYASALPVVDDVRRYFFAVSPYKNLSPNIVAELQFGLTIKAESVLDTDELLSFFDQSFDGLEPGSALESWLTREFVRRVETIFDNAGIVNTLSETEPQRLLQLSIISVARNDRLCSLILSRLFARAVSEDWAAVFAAWIALYFGDEAWSVPGFKKLSWLPPAKAQLLPFLRHWPYRPTPTRPRLPSRTGTEWPKISIVVPSYNQGKYIEETILSLLHQNYPNLEIIVEDGGSTDMTLDVLKRYEDRFASLRSGPDAGQSSALRQGFSKATGEIFGWLNSDDLLAPNALFHVADAYLDGAEVMFGACFEHNGTGFIQANLPRATAEDFNVKTLANLKNRWFMGYFFYQPETFFAAAAYRRAGNLIDPDLHYTMDYDLWMRLAKAGAEVRRIHWPVALFRRHVEQKTFSLDMTVIEQGNVRDRYVTDITDPGHISAVSARLKTAFSKSRPHVAIVTGKYGRFFPVGFEREIESCDHGDMHVTFHAAAVGAPVAEADVLVLLSTLTPEEQGFLNWVQAAAPGPVKVAWFWDNHHMFRENLEVATGVDIAIAGHDFAKAYLAASDTWLLPSVPLCYTQWNGDLLSRLESFRIKFERDNELHGGFVAYPDATTRNEVLLRLIETGRFPRLKLIDPQTLKGYYEMTEADRLISWCASKASLAANINLDLPIRFFDSMLMGQIPIIPAQTRDIDFYFKQYPQDEFVICKSLEAADVATALDEANALFRKGGPQGVVRRAERSRIHHSFHTRVEQIVDTMRDAVIAR